VWCFEQVKGQSAAVVLRKKKSLQIQLGRCMKRGETLIQQFKEHKNDYLVSET
jgi:hypothetical protein